MSEMDSQGKSCSHSDFSVKRVPSIHQSGTIRRKFSKSGREYINNVYKNSSNLRLIFAKNNVKIYPRKSSEPVDGYLTLHGTDSAHLNVKWIPNGLMSSSDLVSSDNEDSSTNSGLQSLIFTINVNNIAYVHCHCKSTENQQTGVVFIEVDGVNHPPLYFPTSQHVLSFLQCLESAIAPQNSIEPPVCTQQINFAGDEFEDKPKEPHHHDIVFRIVPKIDSASSTADKSTFNFTTKPKDKTTCAKTLSLRQMLPKRLRGPFISQSGESPVQKKISEPALLTKMESIIDKSPNQDDSSNRSIQNYLLGLISPAPKPDLSGLSIDDQNLDFSALTPDTVSSMASSIAVTPDTTAARTPMSRRVLKTAYQSMRFQILIRVFHGWQSYCRYLKDIRLHLSDLIKGAEILNQPDLQRDKSTGLQRDIWDSLKKSKDPESLTKLYRLIYHDGIAPEIRKTVWPYLLGFEDCKLESSSDVFTTNLNCTVRHDYEHLVSEWSAVETIVRERDKEAFVAARRSQFSDIGSMKSHNSTSLCNEVFNEPMEKLLMNTMTVVKDPQTDIAFSYEPIKADSDTTPGSRRPSGESGFDSSSVNSCCGSDSEDPAVKKLSSSAKLGRLCDLKLPPLRAVSEKSTPEDGEGGTYTNEIIDIFGMNLHRIERDVNRCDRNHPFFKTQNLDRLQNVLCSYVWKNLNTGYVQGMCDLAAPLLVLLEDECLTYHCFEMLMKRMAPNFSLNNEMDSKLSNIRLLLQVTDSELFECMRKMGAHNHFYFCYRWFLLDFKREFPYNDIYCIWETIWAADRLKVPHFDLFIALALIQTYRDVIMDTCLEFSDIIKFFNEGAEKHDASGILDMARQMLHDLHLML